MVKKFLKFLAYTIFFLFALVVFVPKSSLYFLMEHNIKPLGVVVSNETLHENLFSLDVQHAEVSVKGVDAAEIKNIHIILLGLYNQVIFQDIKLSSMAASFVPLHIKDAKISYTVIDPLYIKGYAEGDFGKATLMFHLKDFHLKAILHPSKLMLQKYRTSLREFKKAKNGEYRYDKAL